MIENKVKQTETLQIWLNIEWYNKHFLLNKEHSHAGSLKRGLILYIMHNTVNKRDVMCSPAFKDWSIDYTIDS